MRAAANFAFANRQMMAHRVREAFEKVLGRTAEDLGMGLVYDVAHNIAKFEEHCRRRATEKSLRAPEGGDPGLPARAPGPGSGIQRSGPARLHSR